MNRYRLPLITWQALNDTVRDIDTRLARLEGRQALFTVTMAIISGTNIAVLSLAIKAIAGG